MYSVWSRPLRRRASHSVTCTPYVPSFSDTQNRSNVILSQSVSFVAVPPRSPHLPALMWYEGWGNTCPGWRGVCYRIWGSLLSGYVSHVSCMYRERILMCPVHIHQDTSGYNKIHLQIRTSLDTIEIHVSHYVSLMYPACILNVSSNLYRYMYLICIPHVSRMYSTCKIHISWCIWYVSQNVSWTRLGYV